MTVGNAIRRWRDEVGDTSVLGSVRVAIGLLLFWNALRAASELQHGYFADASVFYWPMLPSWAVPSREAYGILVVTQVLLSALVVAGHRARGALLASALLGLYVLLCDRLQFHHNRYALFCYALLLSLSPCDRAFTVGFVLPGMRIGPLWAARLAALQVSIVYVASGGSKLLDPDWRSGRVLLQRFALFGQKALDAGVPRAVLDAFMDPAAAGALAKLAIATELLLSIGLWSRKTRILALWCGVWFHLIIEGTSRVEGFTWLTLAMYGLFVVPDVRVRKFYYDGERTRGRALAALVFALDWLLRFEQKPWAPDGIRRGHTVVVVRRDMTHATGLRALAMVSRCTPLFFPLWAPLAVLASFTKGALSNEEDDPIDWDR